MAKPALAAPAALLALAVLLGACGGRPMDLPVAGEMKKGPGLFSGKAGAFVFGDKKPEAEE